MQPTPAEQEILRILWPLKEAKVQTIHDQLSKSKNIGYTSTLKTMQIMEQKGLLGRRKEGRSHIYYPLIEQVDTQSSLLDKLIHNLFGGSQSKLIMQLLDSNKVSSEELAEIKNYIKKMERKK